MPALPAQLSQGRLLTELSACRSIPARNLLRIPGVHLNQATEELCICCLVGCVAVHVCCYLYLSVYHYSSLFCLCCPSITSHLFTLSRLPAAFSETLAAFRHSLAMTSSPIPPAGHYPIEPLLVSSARSRYAHWRQSRQPQSAWQAPVPWAANRLRLTRDSLHLSIRA